MIYETTFLILFLAVSLQLDVLARFTSGERATSTLCIADCMSYRPKLKKNGGNCAALYTLILALE
jgi:hypothetical protein